MNNALYNDQNILSEEIKRRCTFAIISHPDAGKTTITEKMLYLSKTIRSFGKIKPKKNTAYTQSDWMEIEKKRGISVTTSVIRFLYRDRLINLLDTPGHADFSEDTYRILTAVDCCLMVIDAAKGIEERTRKLIQVAKIQKIPIITFINKIDRNYKDLNILLNEIELELNMLSSPINYPIEYNNNLLGLYNVIDKKILLYSNNSKKKDICNNDLFNNLNIKDFSSKNNFSNMTYLKIKNFVNVIKNNFITFKRSDFLTCNITPILFGSALDNFGINFILDFLVKYAPFPQSRLSNVRKVYPDENKFSGFVFKIQANMNLKHRDRIAFLRIVSGKYFKGIKIFQVRTQKKIIVTNAVSFLANNRILLDVAYPGDIIGIYNHGTVKIGDTFTAGENLNFVGIPSFSSEIFKSVHLINPMHQKRLLKGLFQISEEGAIQVFTPLVNNNLIIGAIGPLQFDVVLERLKLEYKLELFYKEVNIFTTRWISSKNINSLNTFILHNKHLIGLDREKSLVYFAPNMINLKVIISKNKDIFFSKIKEYQSY
ncbi:Peptide chain release factor RF3 [Buchnera aphidicola (Thelaxes suberi)]|uniref:peptide chain release factor 3 n=1 Tax=Buchnera aphidicola TaxID=9 RepID=UPI003463CB3E